LGWTHLLNHGRIKSNHFLAGGGHCKARILDIPFFIAFQVLRKFLAAWRRGRGCFFRISITKWHCDPHLLTWLVNIYAYTKYWLLLLFSEYNHMVKSMEGYGIFEGIFVNKESPLAKLLAQLQAIKTSQRSCIVIPRSFNKAYSPGHLSIGDKASPAEFEGTFGVIVSQYHHAS
jgi:hypothetical protein